MAKRINLRTLQKHDALTGDSIVRQLEMEVDAVLTSAGYSIQFWRDVQLYGVDEAILYVENGKHGNAAVLREKWNQLKMSLEVK